jgi:hypothetical protein
MSTLGGRATPSYQGAPPRDGDAARVLFAGQQTPTDPTIKACSKETIREGECSPRGDKLGAVTSIDPHGLLLTCRFKR